MCSLDILDFSTKRMEVVPSTNIVFSMEEEGEELPEFKIGKTSKTIKSPEKIRSRKLTRSPRLGFKSKSHIKVPQLENMTQSTEGYSHMTPLMDTPVSDKDKRSNISSLSDIELPKVKETNGLVRDTPTKANKRIRNLYASSRSQGLEDTGEFSINPDPVPYQPQNFIPHRFDRLSDYGDPLSSTLLKKVPIPRRHLDTFGGYGYEVGTKKGVILHTDRYQWDGYRSLDFLNQRERLQAEFEYMEKLRGIKRRREVMPHRSNLDLLMGGKKVEFCERFEIQREIQKLKSLILPQNARDLYHGRGFRLPDDHNSIKPRRAPALDIDLDDQKNFRVPKGEAISIQHVNPFDLQHEDTFTPYVTRQGSLISPTHFRSSMSLPAIHSPTKRYQGTILPSAQGMLLSPRHSRTGGARTYMN